MKRKFAKRKIRHMGRGRLFRRIDSRPTSAVVWLVAGGGYGKTTLALSYAATHGLRVVTLPLPENGLTTGEFFYLFREAIIRELGDSAEQLPLLKPEYAAAPDNFARNFTHALQQFTETPTLFLFDNLHHLDEDGALHGLIASICAELADSGSDVIITSRHEPPMAWALWRARSRVEIIDEAALAFEEQEVAALLTHQGYPDAEGIDVNTLAKRFHAKTGGWVAGLMLLCEHWRRTGVPPVDIENIPSAGDWFAHEIFEPLDEVEQQLLLCCSAPPRIFMEALPGATGVEDAAERLRRFCQEHAFIQEESSAPGFRMHDLFRAFLRQRAGEAMGDYCQRWGYALQREGDWATAIPLLLEAGEYLEVGTLLKQNAGEMLQTGRGENLYTWLQHLPEGGRREDPHLLLWEGMCLLLHDTKMARALLSMAWERLSAADDYIHMAIAWTGIVDSIWLEWAHVSEYGPWIDAFNRHEAAFRAHLPAPLWFAALRGILTATCYGEPNSPALGRWEREALESLNREAPPTDRLMLASQLMYLNTWQFGRRAGATRVMTAMAAQQEVIEAASPLARCLWHTFTSLWALLYEGDYQKCRYEAEAGRTLIYEYGIGTWDCAVPPMHAALCVGDRDGAVDWTKWFFRTECRSSRPFYDTFQGHFLAGDAWLRGDIAEAVEHAMESLVSARRHGSVVIFGVFRAILASLLAECGRFGQALQEAAEARRTCRELESDFLTVAIYFQLARIPLLRGQAHRALPYLQQAFTAGARQRLYFPFMVRPDELRRMCALARENGLYPDYADWLEQCRASNYTTAGVQSAGYGPSPLPQLQERYPDRALYIETFGGLQLKVASGDELELTGRPRELLKALLIEGGEARISHLSDMIWPDADGDAARRAFDTALHRLRHQVGGKELLPLSGGVLRLDRQRVWLDLWELKEVVQRSTSVDDNGSDSHLRLLLDLYKGPLMVGEDEPSTLLQATQRYQQKYVRAVLQLLDRVQPQVGRSEAEQLCDSALERAPDAQPLQQWLNDK